MHLPKIIAVCGAKRAGKDTIANILCDKYGYKHIKIAQKLKDICKILFSFTDDQLETDIKEDIDRRWNISPRQAMQFIGTEVMQYQIQHLLPGVDRNFWMHSIIKEIDANPELRYVISDLRFLHEAKMLREKDAVIIKVCRDRAGDTHIDNHVSELEYIKINHDLLIKNNGTVDNVVSQIESFFGR